MKIYRCPICGNIVVKLTEGNGSFSCCGKKMELLEANTLDGAREKHLPVYKISEDKIEVTVGEVLHPMTTEHYIEWILIERENGFSLKELHPNEEPKAIFKNNNDIKAIYEYCNLHGLYKTDVK